MNVLLSIILYLLLSIDCFNWMLCRTLTVNFIYFLLFCKFYIFFYYLVVIFVSIINVRCVFWLYITLYKLTIGLKWVLMLMVRKVWQIDINPLFLKRWKYNSHKKICEFSIASRKRFIPNVIYKFCSLNFFLHFTVLAVNLFG